MTKFDEDFNYDFNYQIGGTRGWSLDVSDTIYTDFQQGDKSMVKVCVSSYSKTKFVLNQRPDGTYLIKVGQGKYLNWCLTLHAHPKKKNIQNLVVTPLTYQSSYWYFDQIKNVGWDKNRIILKNAYYFSYVGAVKQAAWKRNDFSFYVFAHNKNTVGGAHSTFRIQQNARSLQYLQKVKSNQNIINQLKNKCGKASKDLQNFEELLEKNKNILQSNRTIIKDYINFLQKQILQYNNKNNSLGANINQLEQSNRIYSEIKNSYSFDIQSIKCNIKMLQNQKNSIYQTLSQTQDNIRDSLQQLQELQIQNEQNLQKALYNISQQQQIKYVQQFENNYQKFESILNIINGMMIERKKIGAIKKQISQIQQECLILYDLRAKIQQKNQVFSSQIIKKQVQHQEFVKGYENQIQQQKKLNNYLLQKFVKLKQQQFKLKSKSVYFKQLYKQQTGNELMQKFKEKLGLFFGQNKKPELDEQNVQLKERLNILQECLRFHDIQIPETNNDLLFENKEKNNEQEEKQQIKLNFAQSKDNIQDEDYKNLDQKTAKGRAAKKLIQLKKNEILLMEMDDDDQDFQTYYGMREKRQRKLNQKQSKKGGISQTAHLFQGQVSSAWTDQNVAKVIQENNCKKNLAICNIQLRQTNFDMTIYVVNISQAIGIGIYNMRKVLKQDKYGVGNYKPEQHNYYFMMNNGEFQFNDGLSHIKQSYQFGFNSGDTINFKYDAYIKNICLEVHKDNGVVKRINFSVKIWEQKSFRVAILLQGHESCVFTERNNKS